MKDMVAEIGNSNRTMSKEYKILEERPGVVFWKVEDENIKLELNKGNLPRSLGSNFSPVFKSGPARMTLPGGVILFFKNGVDGVKWISAKGLEVKQKLNYGNAYLIKSSPGLPSLELANSLKDDPDIDSAEPNWWREVRLK
jgi:hypothetical protein